MEAGVALGNYGLPIASMGADFRDYDNDGRPDLNITALAGETFPLFHNLGKGTFRDATHQSLLGKLSTNRSGWSNGLFDFNNDGWKDLFTANSDVNDLIDLFQSTHYKQPNSLFANLGNGTFRDVSADAGFLLSRAHRGSAFADFDGDGRIDIVVSALGEPAELWKNISPESNHWIILKLMGNNSNRDGIGARIRLGSQSNHVTTAVGYASSSSSGRSLWNRQDQKNRTNRDSLAERNRPDPARTYLQSAVGSSRAPEIDAPNATILRRCDFHFLLGRAFGDCPGRQNFVVLLK